MGVCFRPLAGNWLGKNVVTRDVVTDAQYLSFRPLAGNWLGKFLEGTANRVGTFPEFPSPCGELVGKDVRLAIYGTLILFLFPSPCGELVGKVVPLALEQTSESVGFRPLAGNWLGKATDQSPY